LLSKETKNKTRNNRIDIRLSEDELAELDFVCRELNLSRSEVLRRGVEIQAQTIVYSY
jgi:hypothetical protein